VTRVALLAVVLLSLAVGCARSTPSTLRLKPLTPPTGYETDGRPGVD
jgi:hypothetical protein